MKHQARLSNLWQRAGLGAGVVCHIETVDAVGLAGDGQAGGNLGFNGSPKVRLGDDLLLGPDTRVPRMTLVNQEPIHETFVCKKFGRIL